MSVAKFRILLGGIVQDLREKRETKLHGLGIGAFGNMSGGVFFFFVKVIIY